MNDERPERMLVTGAGGFLGRRVVRRLVEQGFAVRALVRPGYSPEASASILSGLPEHRVELVTASFSDANALGRAVEGVAAVLHVAASKAGSAAAQVANTVVGSRQLYEVATRARVPRFVLVSSFAVMGAADLPRRAVVDERVPLEPHPEQRDPYSFAKHRQEQLAWQFHRESGLPLVVIRPGVIFGPGQNILSSRIGLNLFGLFLHLGGDNPIPLTYVDNCADAIIRAAIVPRIEGEVFCIVDDGLPTSQELLHRYRREVKPVPYVPVPFSVLKLLSRLNVWYSERTGGHLPAVFTPYKVNAMWRGHHFSNQKAKGVLGWAPEVPMREALDRTLAVS